MSLPSSPLSAAVPRRHCPAEIEASFADRPPFTVYPAAQPGDPFDQPSISPAGGTLRCSRTTFPVTSRSVSLRPSRAEGRWPVLVHRAPWDARPPPVAAPPLNLPQYRPGAIVARARQSDCADGENSHPRRPAASFAERFAPTRHPRPWRRRRKGPVRSSRNARPAFAAIAERIATPGHAVRAPPDSNLLTSIAKKSRGL